MAAKSTLQLVILCFYHFIFLYLAVLFRLVIGLFHHCLTLELRLEYLYFAHLWE